MSELPEKLAYNPSLIDDHMYAIARIEQHQPYQNAAPELKLEDPILFEAGVLTVQGCMEAVEGNRRAALSLFGEANDKLESAQESDLSDRPWQHDQLAKQVALYGISTKPFMRKSLREDRVAEARLALRTSAITELGRLCSLSRGDYRKMGAEAANDAKGLLAEITALSLLERTQHPWTFTSMALPHHDQSTVAYKQDNPNYDLLTTENVPGKPALSHRVQCKLGCLGLCQEIYLSPIYDVWEIRQQVRSKAASHDKAIKQLSGCCDLQLAKSSKEQGLAIPQMLIADSLGEGTEESRSTLDTMSNQVLLQVSLPRRITRHNQSFPLKPSDEKAMRAQRKEMIRRRTARDQLAIENERRAKARDAIAVMRMGPKKAS